MPDAPSVTALLRDRWLDALESDRYEQGRNRLRTGENQFCCLGVLCDIVDPNGWNEDDEFFDYDEWYDTAPPPSISSAAGLTREDVDHLVTLNDSRGETFRQIAYRLRTDTLHVPAETMRANTASVERGARP